MPAFYAHYKFGHMVKEKLPAKYQRLLEDYQDLYEIGLHMRFPTDMKLLWESLEGSTGISASIAGNLA